MSLSDSTSALSADDVEAIMKIHNAWLEAERAGDSQAVLNFCTAGVIWITPNSEVLVGQEAIRRWLAGAKVEIVSLEITDVQVRGGANVAHKRSNYRTAYTDCNSTVKRIVGTHLWTLIKSDSNGWQVEVVSWSLIELD